MRDLLGQERNRIQLFEDGILTNLILIIIIIIIYTDSLDVLGLEVF